MIMLELGKKSKITLIILVDLTFHQRFLKPLLDNNYLLKLAPNKSKNQKYLTNKEVYNK